MKRRFLLLLLVPLIALMWALKSASSWRPQLVGVQRNAAYPSSLTNSRLLVDTTDNADGFQVWDTATRRPLWKKTSNTRWLGISSNLRLMVVAHASAPLADEQPNLANVDLQLLDGRDGRFLRSFKGSSNDFHSDSSVLLDLDFSPDERELRVATSVSLRRWRVSDGQLIFAHRWPTKTREASRLSSASFVPDREQLVAFNGDVVVLDARTGKQQRQLPKSLSSQLSTSSGNFLNITPDNFSFYETPDYKDTSRIFRLSDGKLLWSSPDWLTFSSDGKLAFVPNKTGLDVLDAHTGHKLRSLPGPHHYDNFAPSPDGNWLYEARDGQIWKWRAR